MLNEQAVKIAVKIIKNAEGCYLFAYPDPVSPLYEALSRHGMLGNYLAGKLRWKDLGSNFQALSGHPFTVGYGETKGVTKDTVYTLEQAGMALEARVREFMTQAIKDCPKLAEKRPEQIAAITSLAYNIGSDGFKNSTACKKIMSGEDSLVGVAIKMWNKAGGKIVQGLVNRREVEANLYNSVR